MSDAAITDEEFFDSENELLAIFGMAQAGCPRAEDTELTPEHGARIEKIVSEALHEAVVKDTTTFFFKTFGVGLDGLAYAVFSSLCDLSTDAPGDAESPRSEVDPGGPAPDDSGPSP